MKNDLLCDLSPPSKGGKSIISYLGTVCAAATVIVFSALFFTDVSLSAAATLDLGMDFLLLFFSSYVMYSSLFETGKGKAEEKESYKELLEKRAALFKRYRAEASRAALTEFCKAVSVRETEARREALLFSFYMEKEDYSLILKKGKGKCTLKERRVLRQMERRTAVHITPRLLLAEECNGAADRPFSHSPAQMRRRRFMGFLLPSLLTAVFSVSVVCRVIDAPSSDVIVGYLLKLFTLFLNGVKGFRAGFFHVTEEKTRFATEQCFWFEEFFASLEKTNTTPKN